MKSPFVAVTACCLMTTAVTHAEEPDLKAVSSPSRASASGDVDVRALLRDVGARTHKKLIWDPRLPQTIDIGNLPRPEITFPQLQALLQLNGFLLFEKDGLTEAMPVADARQAPTPVVSADGNKAADEEIVTVVLPLKNISAAQLVPILRPLMPQYAHLAAFPDRNALLLTDRSANVRRLVEIARIMDALPRGPAEFQPKP
jgi:general secretion pathway protein D